MPMELWHRPWARLDRGGAQYVLLADFPPRFTRTGQGPIWLCVNGNARLTVDGKPDIGMPTHTLQDGRKIYAMPIPTRSAIGLTVSAGRGATHLVFDELPDRPHEDLQPKNEKELEAKALLERVKSVWARLREVQSAIADPAHIWEHLTEIWLAGDSAADPEMDIIVKQARHLQPVLELLDRAPRRILRRTQSMIPLSRVQEIDRKAMTWLIRQPGETMAERAGNRQRIQAVAREENFNTLENRVLLSYAKLAGIIARQYATKHQAANRSARVRVVFGYGKRCKSLATDFISRGVSEAAADVTPNFVLQNNPNYRKIWEAWLELLNRNKVLDELWRWQARSWEEFCALLVVIALQSIPGARPIATSPLIFREEQEFGCWLKNVNPLAVFFLPNENAIVELTYRSRTGSTLAQFGAPIWLRLGTVDNNDFLKRWAVWPVWDARGGFVTGELEEIPSLLPDGRTESVVGGMTIRPAAVNSQSEIQADDRAACLTVGPSGKTLKQGIEQLRDFLQKAIIQREVNA